MEEQGTKTYTTKQVCELLDELRLEVNHSEHNSNRTVFELKSDVFKQFKIDKGLITEIDIEALNQEAIKRGHIYNRYKWDKQTSCFMGTNEVNTPYGFARWTTLLNVKGIWLEADEIEISDHEKLKQLWNEHITTK